MEQNQYIVALEIGSSKIVGAIAEKSPSGVMAVNHISEEHMTNCVKYGCILNVENVKSAINRIIKDLEDSIGGNITQMFVGISGRSLHSEVSEVKRSIDSSKPITDSAIEQIIADAHRNVVKNYETVDVVPRAYYVDKNETEMPVGQIGSTIKVKVNLIVAKPAIKMNLTRVMSMTYTSRVHDYLVTALATGEQVLSESERALGCMLVDIGAETTTVTIYKKGVLIYMATLPLGGRTITRDIMAGANVMEETAERIKQNISNPLDPKNVDSFVIEGVSSKEAAGYISSRTGEIIANIDKQLDYAEVSRDEILSIVLIGGGSLLQGLPQRLEEVTKIKNVSLGQAPKSIDVRNNSINRLEYVQVLSLLAEAANKMRPGETCVEREFYGNGPVINQELPHKQNEEKPEEEKRVEEKPTKPKKPGFFKVFKKKLSELMTEDEEDDE